MLQMRISIVNKKEFEESSAYKEINIFLPRDEEDLRNDFKYLNLDYDNLSLQDTHITKCEISNFINDDSAIEFNNTMRNLIRKFINDHGHTTSFQEIQQLYNKVRMFDYMEMEKFLAVITANENNMTYIHDVIDCAEKLNNYELLDDVRNLEEMGEYLVHQTAHFDISTLADYIDYVGIAKDYSCKGCVYEGTFTKHGYLMKKEFQDENKIENEEEFE